MIKIRFRKWTFEKKSATFEKMNLAENEEERLSTFFIVSEVVSFMKAIQRMSFNFSTIITVVEFLNEQINSKPLIQLSDDRKITTVTGTLIHENQ